MPAPRHLVTRVSWSPRAATEGVQQGLRNSLGWAAKSAAAGVVAWVLADRLTGGGGALYAPLVAVLSVHPTVVRTLRDSGQRLAAVGLGLAIGYAGLMLAGLRWWSLGLVLLAAMALSTWRRLGAEGAQVPVGALLLLLLADQPTRYAADLLAEGVIGVACATLVNLVVVPPLHVQDADRAITDLRRLLGDALDQMSRDLEDGGWPHPDPAWVGHVGRIDEQVRQVRSAVETGSESIRVNPRVRSRQLRGVSQAQRQAALALEHVALGVREIARLLSESASDDGASLLVNEFFRPRLAAALRTVAAAVSSYGDPSATPDSAAESSPLGVADDQLRRLQEELAEDRPTALPALLAEGSLVTQLSRIVQELHLAPTHGTRR